jgi:putative endonuclease
VFYVYLLQSEEKPDERYVGFTTDLKARLKTHNSGGSAYTAEHKPWKLVGYHAFADEPKAREFEYYLRTSRHFAFVPNRHGPHPAKRTAFLHRVRLIVLSPRLIQVMQDR